MKTLHIEIPDRLARDLEAMVQKGWFVDEAELTRQALRDLLQRQRLEMQEDFHREDIQWALGLSDSST